MPLASEGYRLPATPPRQGGEEARRRGGGGETVGGAPKGGGGSLSSFIFSGVRRSIASSDSAAGHFDSDLLEPRAQKEKAVEDDSEEGGRMRTLEGGGMRTSTGSVAAVVSGTEEPLIAVPQVP